MTEINLLRNSLKSFAGMSDDAFDLSEQHWQVREYKKGELYNDFQQVCKYLGFVVDGVFRTYYLDEKSGDEKNVFFYTHNQIVVSYASFINQVPCHFYTQAMVTSKVIYIHIDYLLGLYRQSHEWERFGRLIAEQASNVALNRTESLLFQTAEQRYIDLVSQHPDIMNAIPLYHISSYLGIQGPSLSRIRKRLSGKGSFNP
ncbi:Crp/Fnr family transcriptional regulator [Arcicella sp. LKC2W]|uniref:Crp/Fnr family transcriptional regulator n=1 Tax=Arcicella sp. LKC2W TaxID=2984198 RepID=UPI002B212B77|nr:Crp/Fnr family transcriptional regulator [Arcicella sp. LKC2W]MEA5459089.1 Crp/Fnr family transcriptional regulator [Arcicella sp. LKC2W]